MLRGIGHRQWSARRTRIVGLALLATALFALQAGCSRPRFDTPDRLDRGLVLILPGIEGEGILNRSIAAGLNDAGVPDGIEIYDWTGTRLLMFTNTMRYQRNLRQASLIAHKISEYQRSHPGNPVHLIGHSGGGGLAVMVLEQLGKKRPITAAILLAPALSPSHNLAEALERTEYGIYNFWSPGDVAWLGLGTTTFGNMDREHGPAAGMVGFKVPAHLSKEDSQLYSDKLHQVSWRQEMLKEFHLTPHMGWASRTFVKEWLGRIVLAHRLGRKPDLQ